MKIGKLTTKALFTVKPTIYSKKNNRYFNIRHGSVGDGLHTYTIGIDKYMHKPELGEEAPELTNDDYTLIPIYNGREQVKDSKDQYMYYLSRDDVDEHKSDYIILWEIPNKFYREIKYEIIGNVKVLGEGTIGKYRDGIDFISPAPVLEIYGPCELSWTAIRDNKKFIHTSKFDGNSWNVGTIEIDERNDDGTRSD